MYIVCDTLNLLLFEGKGGSNEGVKEGSCVGCRKVKDSKRKFRLNVLANEVYRGGGMC